MLIVQHYLKPVYHLLFPRLCNGCGNELLSNEQPVCLSCLTFIPKTGFHLLINNPMEQKLAGRVKIENAIALYYFNKGGLIQNLLHGLKYRQKTETGHLLGKQFGRQLSELWWIDDIDLLIPVPLSKQKLKARGFNQSDCLADGIAGVINKPVNNGAVIRTKNTESQTNKTRAERLSNVADAFSVTNAGALCDKHILLIDDVITTGATLEVCAATILQIPGCRVSIATLAYAVE